jgi:HSP20 family protein
MALIRWEPVREVQSLQQEMNRLFGAFFDTPSAARGNGGERQWIPAMDLVEADGEYVLRADLPGLGEQDVAVELEDDVLTISGERRSEHERRAEGYRRVERATGRFTRSLTLPDGVQGADIRASFRNGVLEVRIPKPERRQPQRIAIAVGDEPQAIDVESRESDEQAAA